MKANKVIRYNQKISILKVDNLKDEDGYPIPIENAPVIYTCWADINNLYGRLLFEAMKEDLQDILNVKVRYCKQLEDLFLNGGLKNRAYKIKFKNIIYDIVSVDFLNFEKVNIIFKVKAHE